MRYNVLMYTTGHLMFFVAALAKMTREQPKQPPKKRELFMPVFRKR